MPRVDARRMVESWASETGARVKVRVEPRRRITVSTGSAVATLGASGTVGPPGGANAGGASGPRQAATFFAVVSGEGGGRARGGGWSTRPRGRSGAAGRGGGAGGAAAPAGGRPGRASP